MGMVAQSVATILLVVAAASASVIGGLAGNGAIVVGPSGTVIRSGLGVVAPGLGLGLGLGHAGIVGPAGILSHGLLVPAGSGLEGQWIPDINEHLYDDGSYKPYIYGH